MKKLIKGLRSIFEKNNIYSKLEKINKTILDKNFWQDKSNSKKIIKEKKLFEELINSYSESVKSIKDLDDLYQLAIEENNKSVQDEVSENIITLRKQVKKMR